VYRCALYSCVPVYNARLCTGVHCTDVYRCAMHICVPVCSVQCELLSAHLCTGVHCIVVYRCVVYSQLQSAHLFTGQPTFADALSVRPVLHQTLEL
jgi:hypothetical protein